MYNIKFSHIEKSKVLKFHFMLIENENQDNERILFFHTYIDFSGFPLNFDITSPRDYINLGVEIIANMDYIRNKVNQEYKRFKEEEHVM